MQTTCSSLPRKPPSSADGDARKQSSDTSPLSNMWQTTTLRWSSATAHQQSFSPTNLLHSKQFAMSMSSRHSLNLYHVAAGFPTKPIRVKPIKNRQFALWPGLTAKAVIKHFPIWRRHRKGMAARQEVANDPPEQKQAMRAMITTMRTTLYPNLTLRRTPPQNSARCTQKYTTSKPRPNSRCIPIKPGISIKNQTVAISTSWHSLTWTATLSWWRSWRTAQRERWFVPTKS